MKRILALSLVISTLLLILPDAAETQTSGKQALPDSKKPKIVSLQPAEPALISYDAGTVRYLATSEDTNGAWSLVELTEMPGYKTRYHRHIYTDEAYYVLEGVFTAKIADKTY